MRRYCENAYCCSLGFQTMGYCRLRHWNWNHRSRGPDLPGPHGVQTVRGRLPMLFLARLTLVSRTKQWIWLPILALFIMVGLTGAGATAATLIVSRAISSRKGLVKSVVACVSFSWVKHLQMGDGVAQRMRCCRHAHHDHPRCEVSDPPERFRGD